MKRLHVAIRAILRKIVSLHRQDGISLVEVMVALALTGSVVVMSLSSLTTGSKAVGALYEQTMAESVAQSQLEYTKHQDYIPIPANYDTIPSLPSGFTVSVEASDIASRDENIQKIKVTVYRDGDPILFKEDYKVNR